ncbi:MAG: hypothetical protein DRO16_02950 [Thermoprotei archaeon]|nr:MAG: hypothetical protein DRO16_02950 [Thermoprotei archaeon]
MRIYARKNVRIDIDGDGEKEDAVAFLLRGTFVLKLRKQPPKRMIRTWRKVRIKPGVTANVAVLKAEYEGERGGRTVLTSIWYDLDHLAEVHKATRRLILQLLKQVPEDELTDEQKRALSKFKRMKLGGDDVVSVERVTKLSESKRSFWHNALPFGKFYYTSEDGVVKIEITKELCEKMVENFKKGIPHYKLPVNINHDDYKGKYGDVVDMEVRDDGLWVKIELTEEGTKLVESKKFEYLSAEYTKSYIDKRTGQDVGPVFLGVALTNRPAHPEMKPIKLAERLKDLFDGFLRRLSEIFGLVDDEVEVSLMIPKVDNTPKRETTSWDWDWSRDGNAIIEKLGWRGLYRACAYVDTQNYEVDSSDGLPHNKQAYKLPHHKLEGDDLVLDRAGVIAAMRALLGARGGVDIPDRDKRRVYEHLAAHYRAFDMEPPEFHLSEEGESVEQVEKVEEEVAKVEEQLDKEVEKELSENEKLLKRIAELEAKVAELEKEKKKTEVEAWSENWKHKGAPPAFVDEVAELLLEEKIDYEKANKLMEQYPVKLTEAVSVEEHPDKGIDFKELAEQVVKYMQGGEA